MKKPKSIFYIIYFIFHLGLLLASIYTNYKSEDFEFLLWLRGKMALMVYVSIAGMLLFFIDLLLTNMEARNRKKEKEALEREINSMKAKMFDLQEATKASVTVASAPAKTADTSSDASEEQ